MRGVFLPFLLISGVQKASSATSLLGIIKHFSRRQECGQWAAGEEARHICSTRRRSAVFLFPSRGLVGHSLRVSRLPGFSQQMACRRELRLSPSDSVHAEVPHMQAAKDPKVIAAGAVLLGAGQSEGSLGSYNETVARIVHTVSSLCVHAGSDEMLLRAA